MNEKMSNLKKKSDAKRKQELFRKFQKLNLSDDFLFAKVMEDEEVCRRVLEMILGIRIKKVKILEYQSTKYIGYDSKGIRIDVFVEDEDSNTFSVEMQNSVEYNLSKRSRYYHGTTDVERLQKGCDYDELEKNYVIFICTFDPFGKGLHKYTFENLCLEDESIRLNDETHTIFLNTKGTADDVSEEMLTFLSYIEKSTDSTVDSSDCELVDVIHERVKEVKRNRTLGVEYVKLIERDEKNRAEGIKEGMEKGMEAQAIKDAKNMLKEGLSPEQIVRITGLPAEKIEKLK